MDVRERIIKRYNRGLCLSREVRYAENAWPVEKIHL